MRANQPERMSSNFVTSGSCTGHSSCASAMKFKYMRVNLSVTNLLKFHGPWSILWPDLWPLKIGHKFYHEFLIQFVPQFVFVILMPLTHPNCNSWGSFEKFRKFANLT